MGLEHIIDQGWREYKSPHVIKGGQTEAMLSADTIQVLY